MNRTNSGPEEIVERLKEAAEHTGWHPEWIRDAADEIERLRAKASDVVRTAGLVAMGDLGQSDLDEAMGSLAEALHPLKRSTS